MHISYQTVATWAIEYLNIEKRLRKDQIHLCVQTTQLNSSTRHETTWSPFVIAFCSTKQEMFVKHLFSPLPQVATYSIRLDLWPLWYNVSLHLLSSVNIWSILNFHTQTNIPTAKLYMRNVHVQSRQRHKSQSAENSTPIFIRPTHELERTQLEKITVREFVDDVLNTNSMHIIFVRWTGTYNFLMNQASAFNLKFYRIWCTKCNLL